MEFLPIMNVWHKRALAGVLGAAAGYAYYYFIGCVSGTCPITSNPYITTLYGSAVGALLVNNTKNKETEHGNDTSATAD